MKSRLMWTLMFVALGVACGGDGSRRGGDPQSYESVQEGSASGVTSTIQGPGEVLPPITGTNADTTTAFTIDPNAIGTAPAPLPPNAVAGAMPAPSSMGQAPMVPPAQTAASGQAARPASTASQPRPVTQPSQPTPSAEPREEPRRETPPPPTPAEPTRTDTTGTVPPTNTAPPPESEEEEEEEPYPPPTTTDTRGAEEGR